MWTDSCIAMIRGHLVQYSLSFPKSNRSSLRFSVYAHRQTDIGTASASSVTSFENSSTAIEKYFLKFTDRNFAVNINSFLLAQCSQYRLLTLLSIPASR